MSPQALLGKKIVEVRHDYSQNDPSAYDTITLFFDDGTHVRFVATQWCTPHFPANPAIILFEGTRDPQA